MHVPGRWKAVEELMGYGLLNHRELCQELRRRTLPQPTKNRDWMLHCDKRVPQRAQLGPRRGMFQEIVYPLDKNTARARPFSVDLPSRTAPPADVVDSDTSTRPTDPFTVTKSDQRLNASAPRTRLGMVADVFVTG